MSYAFYIFAFIAVAAALGILFARRLFHADPGKADGCIQ